MKRFLVVAGDVISRNDGQRHHISAWRLVELYRVDPRECILIEQPIDAPGLDRPDLILLSPRADGDYRLPEGK